MTQEDCILEVLKTADGRPPRNVMIDIIGLLSYHGFHICRFDDGRCEIMLLPSIGRVSELPSDQQLRPK